jgi:hypothetical protein
LSRIKVREVGKLRKISRPIDKPRIPEPTMRKSTCFSTIALYYFTTDLVGKKRITEEEFDG